MPQVSNSQPTRLICLSAAAILLSISTGEATARPPYLKLFTKQYQHLARQVMQEKCLVCHVPKADGNKKKKPRNIYGRALERTLVSTNENGKKRIINVFILVEREPSAIKGKTFGDLIKAGKLPASTE